MNENVQTLEKNSIIDLGGKNSGGPLKSKRMIIGVIGAIVINFALSSLNLTAYGENCAKALGFLFGIIFWMVVTPLDMTVAALIIAVGGFYLGLFSWDDISTQLGKSNFFTLFGMLIISNSLSFTPFAQRFSYFAIMKFGKKPLKLFLIVGVLTSFISWFMSNIGVSLLMAGICNTLLLAMGEKPGKSNYGRAMLLMINMTAYFGGCVLIGGSPNGNVGGMSYMQTAVGDAMEITVSYGRWALTGIPSWLILIVPMMLVYAKYFKVDKCEINVLPKEYYESKLKELGPISGSEIRWVIILVGFVVTLLIGVKTAVASLLWALVTMLPGIGLKDCKSQLKALPIGVLLCVAVLPMLGTIITTHGVAQLIGDLFVPLLGNMGPLAFSILSTFIMFLLMNLLVNATHGAHVLAMNIAVPVAMAMGYNPLTVLMPMLLCGGWFWCVSANYLMMMTHGYGWWDMKDSLVPGFISGLLCVIVVPIVNYLVCILSGISMFL